MKTAIATFLLALLFVFVPCLRAAEPEPLLGIFADMEKGTLSIDVFSNGCTKKEDFRFDLSGGVLTITRTTRDACKAMPQRITLTFTLKEAGLEPKAAFRLGNPIVFGNRWGA